MVKYRVLQKAYPVDTKAMEAIRLKTAITVRVNSELLAAVRACAKHENRTLTNFIETVLLAKVSAAAGSSPQALPAPDLAQALPASTLATTPKDLNARR